jgi:hypothetical protein
MAKKSAKIIEIKEMMGETGLIIIEHVGIDPLMELREEMETLEDTRFEPYMVMITLLAVMAQANEWNEIVVKSSTIRGNSCRTKPDYQRHRSALGGIPEAIG